MTTPVEEWRAIRGFAGYEVSSLGGVRSVKRAKPKMLSPERTGGYRRFHLYRGGKDYPMLAHRLVALAFLPPAGPGKEMVLHCDGNPANNAVSNLRWGDAADNMADALKHGTFHVGEDARLARFSEAQAIKAKAMLRLGTSVKQIAAVTGMSSNAVYSIRAGRAWRHVEQVS